MAYVIDEAVIEAAKKNPELSVDEVVDYFKKQGHIGATEELTRELATKFVKEARCLDERAYQYKLAVVKGMDLCDFDRWIHLQDVIFGKNKGVLDIELAFDIIDLLYDKDIEILESPVTEL